MKYSTAEIPAFAHAPSKPQAAKSKALAAPQSLVCLTDARQRPLAHRRAAQSPTRKEPAPQNPVDASSLLDNPADAYTPALAPAVQSVRSERRSRASGNRPQST